MRPLENHPVTKVCLPFAILRHDLPDASCHFDWLFAQEDPPTTALQTFRTSEYPETVSVGTKLKLEPRAKHRLLYLTYEGALSRKRGTVRRLASGHYQLRNKSARHAGWAGQNNPGQQICLWLTFTEQQKNTRRQLWDFDLLHESATLLEVEAG